MKTIIWLFLLVLVKRVILNKSLTSRDLVFILGSLSIFLILSRLYNASNATTTYFPYLYAILSYYSHSGLIFRALYESSEDPSMVIMTKDVLFRHLVQFAALSMNLIYILTFLVITRRDCIILNIVVWSLFIYDVFTLQGMVSS